MENEVLIALLSKHLDEKISQIIPSSGTRGLRGFIGPKGDDGKGFDFTEHAPKIRQWAKEFALKFEDLSDDQISKLIGPKGRDGKDGRDGDGFTLSEYEEEIKIIIKSVVDEMSDSLKLRFSDLTLDDIDRIRGPKGRDGRDGRGFNFDEHRDYFDSLRLNFSDLSEVERDSLTLHFSNLTTEEKESLKLRFKDLTPEDIALLRGPRGSRGQRGPPGRDPKDGKDGRDGKSIRGLPGIGIQGRPGKDAIDGQDGKDAPQVTSIKIDQIKDDIVFVFEFSDGTEIRSEPVTLPTPVNVYGGGSSGKRGVVNYDVRIDEVSDTTTYVGKTVPGNLTSSDTWQIQRITVDGTETIIEFADGNATFDNVWDDRAILEYS